MCLMEVLRRLWYGRMVYGDTTSVENSITNEPVVGTPSRLHEPGKDCITTSVQNSITEEPVVESGKDCITTSDENSIPDEPVVEPVKDCITTSVENSITYEPVKDCITTSVENSITEEPVVESGKDCITTSDENSITDEPVVEPVKDCITTSIQNSITDEPVVEQVKDCITTSVENSIIDEPVVGTPSRLREPGKDCITYGPWVGDPPRSHEPGEEWRFMPQGLIEKISISYGKVIHGIEFQSDCSSKDATQKSLFGSKSGDRTDTISLDHPNEYLTSIHGRLGYTSNYEYVLLSLSFVTNRNCYGPYGSNEGTRFSYDGKGGVIVGFQGRTGKYIKVIGIYVMPESLALDRKCTCEQHSKFQICCRMSRPLMPREESQRVEDTTTVENCLAHGPWVKDTSQLRELKKKWSFMPQGLIEKISISYGEVIHGMEFQNDCSSKDATTQKSLFGSKSGDRTDTISLDHPNEYLTSIHGRVGYLCGYGYVVMSLCFVTNQNRYGPYGSDDEGTRFSYDGEGGVIVGFHGLAGEYIEGFGIYVMPESLALDPNRICQQHSKFQKCCRMSGSSPEIPREVGPWGASGGKPWDDGVFSNIKQIHVHVGKISKLILAIQIEYVKTDGKSIWSPKHGDRDGDVIEKVNLDGENEYLTGISGFCCVKSNGSEAIASITFHTNKNKYGPYGQNIGADFVYFASTSSPGKVVGFHGRENGVLNAIGVHMEYF